MRQLENEIPFAAFSQVIDVGLARRRHGEHVASDGLGVDAAATCRRHRHDRSSA